MQKVADYIKKLFSKENKQIVVSFFKKVFGFILHFVQKYKRYLGAGLLFILLVLILAKCTGPIKFRFKDSGTENTEVEITADNFVPDKEFKQDAIPELNELIEAYFTAYAADDLDTLSNLAYPMSDNEKSYIGVFSQYIEKYQNISCYSKAGLTKGSYLVSVYYELKFYGVDTVAPGLDFFYVETDQDGKLFINNLYSSYNFSRTENELDPNINAVIIKFEEQDDVAELLADVETKYTEAVSSDVNLATMITSTIPAAMADWLNSINVDDGTESTTTEQPEETETEEKKDDAEKPQDGEADKKDNENQDADTTQQEKDSEEPAKVTVRTIDNVYVRAAATTDSEAYEKALTGTSFTKVGTEGDWTKIEYKGGTAYIKTEFLEEVKN